MPELWIPADPVSCRDWWNAYKITQLQVRVCVCVPSRAQIILDTQMKRAKTGSNTSNVQFLRFHYVLQGGVSTAQGSWDLEICTWVLRASLLTIFPSPALGEMHIAAERLNEVRLQADGFWVWQMDFGLPEHKKTRDDTYTQALRREPNSNVSVWVKQLCASPVAHLYISPDSNKSLFQQHSDT